MTTKELEKRIDALEDTVKFQDKKIDWLTDAVGSLNNKSSQHHEFQVGDRVQFKSDDKINIGIIDDFLREYVYVKSDGLIYSMKIDQIKPATDEPECKFKVGDRVKVRCYGNATKCTIAEIKGDKAKILVEGTSEFGGFIERITEDISDLEPYAEPRWTFTDDEKVILRNLPEKYKWIARDGYGLYVFADKPYYKIEDDCYYCDDKWFNISLFEHIFQSIKLKDDEPCEFRKYL